MPTLAGRKHVAAAQRVKGALQDSTSSAAACARRNRRTGNKQREDVAADAENLRVRRSELVVSRREGRPAAASAAGIAEAGMDRLETVDVEQWRTPRLLQSACPAFRAPRSAPRGCPGPSACRCRVAAGASFGSLRVVISAIRPRQRLRACRSPLASSRAIRARDNGRSRCARGIPCGRPDRDWRGIRRSPECRSRGPRDGHARSSLRARWYAQARKADQLRRFGESATRVGAEMRSNTP